MLWCLAELCAFSLPAGEPMSERLLRLDDLQFMKSVENVGSVFSTLGYNVLATPVSVQDLELPAQSAEAIWDAYLIADQRKGADSLQVMLFHLKSTAWETPSAVSHRMRSIAKSLCRRPSNFLLLGTKDYDQMLLVNPRKRFDAQMNLHVGIRKLLIDCTNPTPYDRDRLEAIAAHNLDPRGLYQAQCDAFDVEKLTKEFYRRYREVFEYVQQVVLQFNRHPYFDDPSRLHQFSQRLLGRIMFLYFLQKKGFLAGDRKFLKNQYQSLRSEPEDTDFYAQILEPLFFDILNHFRPDHASPWGKIPYLNGGLFDRDYGPGVVDSGSWATPAQIQLPNALFDPTGEKSILKFFNSYNFTVAENVEGDEDVAVDPEMLGKVFENMLAAEERGASGTFYTPRGIVQFMCVESLGRYLADETGVDPETIRQLTTFDPVATDINLKKLLSKEQTRKLKRAIESVKVCDPAVGSGAFPMGMMQVILSVWQAISQREGQMIQRGSLRMSQLKRDIIANNLYGVDIKPEAVEIAKLRMWLSLVVDIPDIDEVDPLPNLDYKLMCGNSLISTIHGEQMIPDPTKTRQGMLNVTPVQEAIQPLLALQQRYFDAQTEGRKQLRTQIRKAEQHVFRVAIADRRRYWQIEQRHLEQDIQRLKGNATAAQTKKQQMIAAKLKELTQMELEVERGLRSTDFFQWHLHFNDVFEQKGGFDIVIGNPPYVRQEQIKALKPALQAEYACYVGTADLFVYFYERGFQILRSGGALTYISSNKYMRSAYGAKLRQFLSTQGTIQHLIDFGDAAVFEAIAYPSIIQVTKTPPANHQVCSLTWEPEQSINELTSAFYSHGFLIAQKEFTSEGWRLETPSTLRLLEKLRAAGQPLGEYVNGRFYRGILTGCNEAFVVDRSVRDRLIAEHPSSAEVLKPLLRGRDVKRWRVEAQDLWLIFTRRGINIEAYPAVLKYLSQFKERLTPGVVGGRKPGNYEWYEIQDNIAYWQEFEQPKIIYPDIARSPSFSLSQSNAYLDCTLFFIPTHQIYLAGILNSSGIKFLFPQICPKVRGDFMRFKSIYVSQIPIPQASPSDREAISKLVQKCLDAKGQGVEQWEAEIDDRVGRLYGLTAGEMKQIRER